MRCGKGYAKARTEEVGAFTSVQRPPGLGIRKTGVGMALGPEGWAETRRGKAGRRGRHPLPHRLPSRRDLLFPVRAVLATHPVGRCLGRREVPTTVTYSSDGPWLPSHRQAGWGRQTCTRARLLPLPTLLPPSLLCELVAGALPVNILSPELCPPASWRAQSVSTEGPGASEGAAGTQRGGE